jgi:hypothetical protein
MLKYVPPKRRSPHPPPNIETSKNEDRKKINNLRENLKKMLIYINSKTVSDITRQKRYAHLDM